MVYYEVRNWYISQANQVGCDKGGGTIIYILWLKSYGFNQVICIVWIRFFSFEKHFSFLKVVSATFLQVCCVFLKESTFERRKNAFYFTSKALFVCEIIKF